MNIITQESFTLLIKNAAIKPRFKRDLKFTTSTEHLTPDQWQHSEIIPIWNKSKNGGVLLLQPYDTLHIVAFDDSSRAGDANGRVKPIICDFCYTWQPGLDGNFVTFYPQKSDSRSVSILCCADFNCSNHARGTTLAAKRARAQIREHLTNDSRIERLREKVQTFIARYQIESVDV